jgi:hypothetical protein
MFFDFFLIKTLSDEKDGKILIDKLVNEANQNPLFGFNLEMSDF